MGFFEVFAAALAGFYAVVRNYGLAIILLTVAVRVLLLPLSIKQTRSMREMQRIQPEVKKIQAKYKGKKDARQQMNEEMMGLYKEHGVNPFGGCLPLLMQMPVFIALYRLISTPLAYMGYKKLSGTDDWVPAEPIEGVMAQVQDSALARALDTAPVEVNSFLGVFRLDCQPLNVFRDAPGCEGGVLGFLPYLILIGLMGFTTYYQQKQMQVQRGAATDPSAQQAQMVMKFMPLMLMFFSFQFAAGLTLYWLTTNVWSIVQQHIMLRVAPAPADPEPSEKKVVAQPSKGSSKPSSGKPPKGAPTKPVTGDPARLEGPKQPSKNKKKKR
ncbi:MAG: YidC/Oxa1 family membrane protein insertase [Actinomycetota bacterium]|nr:YidC/Oxa1 family membrane protein insertase [Actinomycetota bacterium]